jgi:putative transposase
MPKRNILKTYGENEYYHVYNRGANRQDIFVEPDDFYYFLSLFKRHLSYENDSQDTRGRVFLKYFDELELVAFCLMPNHFHLLFYLKDTNGLVHLMRGIMTSYTMYINKKYKHTGRLCEGVFLASRINRESYLWHVSRYIYLNPLDAGFDYRDYQYSSIDYLTGKKHADWVHPERLVETEKEKDEYLDFLSDYIATHKELKYLKNVLAAFD